jgi:hypothetical protein
MSKTLLYVTLAFWFVAGIAHFAVSPSAEWVCILTFPLLAVAWFVALVRWLVGPRRVRVEPQL